MSVKWFEIPGYFNYVEQYEMIAHYLPEGSKFVELGCLLGKSTNFLASRLKEYNKKLEFHVVDTFMGTPGEHDHLTDFYDKFYENCKELIDEGYITKVHKGRTDEVYKLFEDNYFDAIMIDADHKYEAVINDVECWMPKMKKTGVVFGDDWLLESVHKGAKEGLNRFYNRKPVNLSVVQGFVQTWIHTLDEDNKEEHNKWLTKIP
tara:strand:- start:1732 stop:2346 length:615 start_codon:yes stop_codon:yes gene_type:complete